MAQTSAKKFVKTIDKIVDLIAVLFLLSFLLYGGYSMWDNNQMYNRASPTAYAAYRPMREEEMGFEQLQAINPNVFGWITIFGTHIDYPLLQSDDNLRYVHTNARGEPARSGAIFLDFRNNQDFTDFNNIIYGHDMARDAMFGEIFRFEAEYFFGLHRYGMLFTGEKYYGIEFFSFLLVDAHDFEIYNPTVIDPELKEILIQRFFNEAIQYRELDVSIDDRLVVLSTCTQRITNGRHILVGRLMEEVPEDVFEGVQRGGVGALSGIDQLGLAVGSLFVIFVTVGITLFITKKKKKKSGASEKEISLSANNRKPPTLLEEFLFLFGKIAMILTAFVLLFIFVFGAMQVNDSSMNPAMREGDIVLFQRIGTEIAVADAIVVSYDGQTQVRRVVAVEGDVVDITGQGLVINGLLQQELYIFEETTQFEEGIRFPITVSEGEIFILGDSRTRAQDSRIYGTVRVDDVLGSVVTVIRRRNL